MPALVYHRPTEIAEAIRLLNRTDVATAPLGGGTTFHGDALKGLEAVVDLRALKLDYLTTTPLQPEATGGPFPLRLGATATLTALAEHELARVWASGLLAQAALRTTSATLRAQATIAGTLVTADSAHPLITALLALEAEVLLWVHDEPHRTALAAFLPYRTALLRKQKALIVEVQVPLSQAHTGGALHVLARTPADRVTLCVAARMFRKQADGRAFGVRVAVGGAGVHAMRVLEAEQVLEGFVPTDDLWARVVQVVQAQVAPESDWLASAEYRRAMAGVLARRAVEDAWAQAA